MLPKYVQQDIVRRGVRKIICPSSEQESIRKSHLWGSRSWNSVEESQEGGTHSSEVEAVADADK